MIQSILLLCGLLTIVRSQAGFDPQGFTSKQWIAAHNIFRSQHCTRGLIWNDTLSGVAQNWTDRCMFEADLDSPLGQNMWKGAGTFLGFFNASRAVDSWYSQINDYNFSDPVYDANVGAVSQVLWQGSSQLGCSVSVCDDDQMEGLSALIGACYYSPPGNFINTLQQNVLPPCDDIDSQVLSVSKGEDITAKVDQEVSSVPEVTSVPEEPAAQSTLNSVKSDVSPKEMSSMNLQSPVNEAEDWVVAHNIKRGAHCVPDIEWNSTLAAAAEKVAQTCQFTDAYPIDDIGANQFTSNGTEVSPDIIVAEWYKELRDYDYSDVSWQEKAGSFTQLVWANTSSVGCAIGRACCPNFGASGECPDAKRYAICLYYPPGNFFGQFKENVPQLCASN